MKYRNCYSRTWTGLLGIMLFFAHPSTLWAQSAKTQVSNGVMHVTLTWEAPTEKADGSPLLNLAGYKICMDDKAIPDTVQGSDCSLEHLDPVTPKTIVYGPIECPTPQAGCYFRVIPFDTVGVEAVPSNQIFTSIDISGPGAVTIRFKQVIIQ